MKIWIINQYAIPPSLGGLVRHYYFSRNLRAMGHEVRIITASRIHNTDLNFIEEGKLFVERQMDEVPYTYVKTCDYQNNGPKRVINMLQFARNSIRVCKQLVKKETEPDLIYISSPTIFSAYTALRWAKKKHIPTILEIRDLWPRSVTAYTGMSDKNPIIRILYRLEKKIYRQADKLIFTMPGGKDYIRDKHWQDCIRESKIYHLNNGVDIARAEKHLHEFPYEDSDLENKNTYKIIYTGSVRSVNNLEFVVHLADACQKRFPDIRFIIFGGGGDVDRLTDLAKKMKLHNITFKGRVDNKYIPSILSAGDLNLLHFKQTDIMHYGGSLNKLFEYLAAGKPILSTVRINYDLIEKYDCGLVAKEQTVESVMELIETFYSMPKERYEEMSRNASNLAKAYDYSVLTKKLLEIIEE
jgi:glycosyltransferase involved in cell wall biosynthesis